MKIAHTYCLTSNIGDYALGIGVKNIFRHLYNVSLFADYNLQGQIFDDYFIEVINKRYDLLIIGGGGIIHGAHWPHGWFWLIEEKNIKKIKIPFIIYGAGYNYFKDEVGIPKKGVLHLKETSERATFFSVRNDGSYERLLSQTGIKSNVVADPGFWIPLDFSKNYHCNKKYIVVQLANDKPEHRFGNLKKREVFVKELTIALKKLSKSYKVIFAPHVFEDIEISKQIADNIENSLLLDFGSYAFDKTSDYISVYKNAEFVISMRGHGQIIPLGFEVPAISLENHSKHIGLMKDYGLERYNINILEDFLSEKLLKICDLLIKNKDSIKSIIKERNSVLLESTKKQLTNIDKIKKYLK